MPQQKLFERRQPAVAIPEGHMLGVGNQTKLGSRRQFSQSERRTHRCTAPARHVIVGAAKYQRRLSDFAGFRQRIPSEARFFMATKHFHGALSRPHRVRQGCHHVAALAGRIAD